MNNIETQKSELINWIMRLSDQRLIQEVIRLKRKSEVILNEKRKFGDGKHIFTYVADDFNEPLDEFRDYMK